MKTCTFTYNLDNETMGRVGMFECKESKPYSFHGGIVLTIKDSFKFCPYCGKNLQSVKRR